MLDIGEQAGIHIPQPPGLRLEPERRLRNGQADQFGVRQLRRPAQPSLTSNPSSIFTYSAVRRASNSSLVTQ